jgi:hypothetical protein
VRRAPIVLLAVLTLSACGGSSSHQTTLYAGGDWKVVVDGGQAQALQRVDGKWHADTSGRVKVSILGPRGTAPRTPQVAAELSAGAPLVESGLWVDGTELLAKGGGLSPTQGTIYGAPAAPLSPGPHVAVAYGRTATHGTAVAWSFRVV